jgi:hypothetical protein
VKKFERSQLSRSLDVLAICLLPLKDTQFLARHFDVPRKSTSLCERQRHTETETETERDTHISSDFAKAFSWVGQFHIIVREREKEREREILEFLH